MAWRRDHLRHKVAAKKGWLKRKLKKKVKKYVVKKAITAATGIPDIPTDPEDFVELGINQYRRTRDKGL